MKPELRQTDSLTSGPGGSSHSEGSSLRGFLGLVRRRKWVILLPTVLVPTFVLLLSLAQTPKYQAKSQIYLRPTDVSTILGNTPNTLQYEPPDRRAQTEAVLAHTPGVARETLVRANVGGLTVQQLLDASSVSASANADILDFAVTVSDQRAAARLASKYADAYRDYRHQLDSAPLIAARAHVLGQLKQLSSKGLQATTPYAALVKTAEQLRVLATLETSNTAVVNATRATQVSPRPLRNTFLGLILGLILGIALAVLWEKIDTRVRTSDEVEDRLGLPILARLPAPSRELAAADKLVMLHEPSGSIADHYRLLRARVELANLDRRAKTVMVSSAYEQEGKSTTAANLALALARAGKRVILVDLDLRNPSLHKYFDLDGRSGVTDLALGATDIRNAGGRVAIPSPGENAEPRDMNGHSPVAGFLRVIPTGPTPADGSTSEFITSAALSTLLEELSADADVLLIDAPPLLVGGDAIALSTKVDAILVVTRLSAVRRPALAELRRVLSDCPAYELGLIVTGAEDASVAGYYSARRRVAAAPASRPRVRARDS